MITQQYIGTLLSRRSRDNTINCCKSGISWFFSNTSPGTVHNG